MKSIKRKILFPFILIIVMTPVITLAAFNIFIRNYIDNGVETQLEKTVMTTQQLIKAELSGTIYETDKDKISESLSNLNRILRTSKIAVNTELLLYKESGELLYPINYNNTFLNEDIIGKVRDNLKNLNIETSQKINIDGEKFIVMGYKLTQLPLENVPYIAFISSMDVSDPLFFNTNVVLIAIMLLGIVIGALLSYRIAQKVEKPVKELCVATEKIGQHKEFVLGHKSDIEEIALLSDSILKMSRRIDAYDSAQKAFLQNASHEIKTPLMSIQGYAEGIEKGLFPDPKKAGSIITQESQRLNRLLTNLLILSRIENQNYDMELEKTSLNEVMKEYIQRLEGIAIKENKKIHFTESKVPLFVPFNDTLFSQSIMNILSNAVRYATKAVSISIHSENGNAIIDVEDDGPGLKEKDLPHIFERFYKGEKGQFGLGLAISKSAIEAMKGSIKAANTETGAKFIIAIPMWKD
ncbi:MAG: sensor histidine kinase [Saccharofermentanales bacterium]